MKLSRERYLIIVRLAVISTIILLLTNAIFIITDDALYLLLSMLSSTYALCFATLIFCSEHKYTWKEVLGIKK